MNDRDQSPLLDRRWFLRRSAGAAALAGAIGILSDTGVAQLDAAAKKAKGKPYAALDAEDDRVAVLKSIEDGPFFQKVRGEMVVALYNQPGVWKALGYEGPSADQGGYIHRGFDDIDWLQS